MRRKSWLACTTVSGVAALLWNLSWTARAVELRVGGDFFSSLLTLCYYGTFACVDCVATLGDLELVHQSDVFYSRVLQFYCAEQCADRNGMAAPRLLEWYLFFSTVLRFWLCFASHSWQIAVELLHHGCDLNVRICTKHYVFAGKRRFRCGKSWLACTTVSGVAALLWNLSWTARAVELRVGGDFFSSLLTLCYYGTFACVDCVATLGDLELVHQSDVFYSRVLQFYCAEQFSLRRSQWNGFAKAARMVLVLQCSSVSSCDSDCGLQVTVGRSHWNCTSRLRMVLWQHFFSSFWRWWCLLSNPFKKCFNIVVFPLGHRQFV